MSEQFSPSVHEKRTAQVPVLIEEQTAARESKNDSSIKLVKNNLYIFIFFSGKTFILNQNK